MWEALKDGQPKLENHVKKVYENFTPEQISAKVAELVKPDCLNGTTEVQVIYQGIENLHEALPITQVTGTLPGTIRHQVVTEWLTRHSSIITKTKTAEATDFD